MMKNRIATLIPAALLALSLAACGQAATNTPAENPAAEATVIEEETQQVPAAEATAEEAVPEAAEAATETAAAETEETVKYTNNDMVLSVPAKYNDLLIVDVTEDDQDGILFKVYEKASVEAAKAQGDDVEGPGWLFSIGTSDMWKVPAGCSVSEHPTSPRCTKNSVTTCPARKYLHGRRTAHTM